MKRILISFAIIFLIVIYSNFAFAYGNEYFNIDITKDYKCIENFSQFPITYEFHSSGEADFKVEILQNPLGWTPERFTQESIVKTKKEIKNILKNMNADYSEVKCTTREIGQGRYKAIECSAKIEIFTEELFIAQYSIISDHYIYTIVVVSNIPISNSASLLSLLNSFKINDTRTVRDEGLLWADIKFFAPYIILILVVLFILIKLISKGLNSKRKNDKYNDIFNAIKH